MEEQIEKAAYSFSETLTLSNWNERAEAMRGFIAGASWRINSVWHKASKEPEEDRTILYYYGAGMSAILHYRQTTKRWSEIVKGISVYRWAYLDDLQPERKEERKDERN